MPGAATLSSKTFTRDAAGRITWIDSDIAREGWTFTYDAWDELTGATNLGTCATSSSSSC